MTYNFIPKHALDLMAALPKCKCDMCKKELKRLEEKYLPKKVEVNKGQAMSLEHPKEKDLKEITLDQFEIQLMELIPNNVQPERLNPEDHFANDGKVICDSLIPENK